MIDRLAGGVADVVEQGEDMLSREEASWKRIQVTLQKVERGFHCSQMAAEC